MKTRFEIERSPILLLELAAEKGEAIMDYGENEAAAMHFYQRLRQLNHGRGKKYGCWVNRNKCIVRAVTDPAKLPSATLRVG